MVRRRGETVATRGELVFNAGGVVAAFGGGNGGGGGAGGGDGREWWEGDEGRGYEARDAQGGEEG